MSVLVFVGVMRDDELTEKSRQQSQIGKNADVCILGDDERLAIQERKDHGNSDCGRIVEPVEDRSGKENPFGHLAVRSTLWSDTTV